MKGSDTVGTAGTPIGEVAEGDVGDVVDPEAGGSYAGGGGSFARAVDGPAWSVSAAWACAAASSALDMYGDDFSGWVSFSEAMMSCNWIWVRG